MVVFPSKDCIDLSISSDYHHVNKGFREYYTLSIQDDCYIPNVKLVTSDNGYRKLRKIDLGLLTNGQSRHNAFIDIHPNQTVDDYKKNFKVSLMHKEKTIISWTFCNSIHNIAKDSLEDYKLPKDVDCKAINILIFGKMGSGKSATLNSFLTLLSRSPKIESFFQVGGNDSHVTTTLTRKKLEEFGITNFRLFDTWGLTKETYKDSELDKIIEGSLPPNWRKDLNFSSEKLQKALKKGKEFSYANNIHGVIFTVPYSELSIEDQTGQFIGDKILEISKRFYKRIGRYCNNPIIVVTKADIDNENYLIDSIDATKDMEKIRDRAAKYFNIAPRCVFFGRNYENNEKKKNFFIDHNNLIILDSILSNAKNNTKKTEVIQKCKKEDNSTKKNDDAENLNFDFTE